MPKKCCYYEKGPQADTTTSGRMRGSDDRIAVVGVWPNIRRRHGVIFRLYRNTTLSLARISYN